MTNYRVENSRRDFLLAIAGGIAGLVAASSPGPVFAQTASGPTLSMSTIGAGREGGALGALFVKAGHPVMFSSRHPDTLKGLIDELGPLARAGTVAEAVEFGDVVMVVVPYTALEQIGKDYGNALAKKMLVIDVSNPIARRDGAAIVERAGGSGLSDGEITAWCAFRARFQRDQLCQSVGGRAPAGRTRGGSDRRRRPARY
jgi:8-hydroxy-5-deazaflavin:NADPH oxidoreductase